MILTKIHHEVEVLLISYPLAWGGTLLCLIPYYFWRKEKENETGRKITKELVKKQINVLSQALFIAMRS